jgi:hypothetical protein
MKCKMVDMKSDKSDKTSMPVKMGMETERYPWGLGLSFNKDVIKKLGLDAEDFLIGSKIDFQITAQVTSASQQAGEKSISQCDMQIIKMGEIELESKDGAGE